MLLIFAFSSLSFSEDLTVISVLNDQVSILAPEGFGLMPNDILEMKYPSSRRPTEVLSDSTGGVTLAFNHTKNAMLPSQVKAAHKMNRPVFVGG